MFFGVLHKFHGRQVYAMDLDLWLSLSDKIQPVRNHLSPTQFYLVESIGSIIFRIFGFAPIIILFKLGVVNGTGGTSQLNITEKRFLQRR